METIEIKIERTDVYDEVEKSTDYTGAKLIETDSGARDRMLASNSDLETMNRFWVEAGHVVNERFKDMLLTGNVGATSYSATLEVSVAFDKVLTPSVEKSVRSFFIAFILGEWFKFAKKDEVRDYNETAGEFLTNAERLLYSRRGPKVPAN